jgi:hypothetical protein
LSKEKHDQKVLDEAEKKAKRAERALREKEIASKAFKNRHPRWSKFKDSAKSWLKKLTPGAKTAATVVAIGATALAGEADASEIAGKVAEAVVDDLIPPSVDIAVGVATVVKEETDKAAGCLTGVACDLSEEEQREADEYLARHGGRRAEAPAPGAPEDEPAPRPTTEQEAEQIRALGGGG